MLNFPEVKQEEECVANNEQEMESLEQKVESLGGHEVKSSVTPGKSHDIQDIEHVERDRTLPHQCPAPFKKDEAKPGPKPQKLFENMTFPKPIGNTHNSAPVVPFVKTSGKNLIPILPKPIGNTHKRMPVGLFMGPSNEESIPSEIHFIPKLHSQNQQQILLLPISGKQHTMSSIKPEKDPSQNNQQSLLLPGSGNQHIVLSQKGSSTNLGKKNTQNNQQSLLLPASGNQHLVLSQNWSSINHGKKEVQNWQSILKVNQPGAQNVKTNTLDNDSNITLEKGTSEIEPNVVKGSSRDEVLNFCTSCQLLFSSFSSFETHMSKYHNIYCTVCKQPCASLSSYETHMAKHYNMSKGVKLAPCDNSTVQNDATPSNTAIKCEPNMTVSSVNSEKELNIVLGKSITESDFDIMPANSSYTRSESVPTEFLDSMVLQSISEEQPAVISLRIEDTQPHTVVTGEDQDRVDNNKIREPTMDKMNGNSSASAQGSSDIPPITVTNNNSTKTLIKFKPMETTCKDTQSGELRDPNGSNEMYPLTRQVIDEIVEIGSRHTTTYKGWHVAVGEHIDFLLYDNLQVSIRDEIKSLKCFFNLNI